MDLYGWKYEGRKIAEKLHEQMLSVIEILNDSSQVSDKTWPSLQPYIAQKLGVAPGQVRTIKRMMEEFGIVKKGILNQQNIPKRDNIYTENGKMLVELLSTEKLMREKIEDENDEQLKEINEIYKLYYQKMLALYTYNENGCVFHPLRATLKAIKKFGYLGYWEWYLLNTIIRSDDNTEQEELLTSHISQYRAGTLLFVDSNIKENLLSHSYVLGNFEYAGLVIISGRKHDMKITLNMDAETVINEIIK